MSKTVTIVKCLGTSINDEYNAKMYVTVERRFQERGTMTPQRVLEKMTRGRKMQKADNH